MSAFDPKRTSGRTRLGLTNGTTFDTKCDIVFIPDLVLGVAEAMRRREFITLLVSAAVVLPFTAHAQKPPRKVYRLGILQPGSPPEPLVDALRERLKELGYTERYNIAYEYRWAEGKPHRLPDLAKELVDLKVDAITTLSTPAALAAQTATQTIPVVFTGVGDPAGTGLVSRVKTH
jgi:putative ABC transport system substrate-binding protein